MLLFIISVRERNFELCVQTLVELLPWIFALDHTHYARWLSVHVCDMMTLSLKHPEVFEEFNAGKFVVQKSTKRFSAIAIDQCHEQNNATVKGSGGAVGPTQNSGAHRCCTVAGPEITRMVKEFEDSLLRKQVTKDTENRHLEQQPAV